MAIVATVDRPGPSFTTWLDYHLQSVDLILLYIDKPEKRPLFATEDERILLFPGSQIKAESAGMHRLMFRQEENVNAALQYCRENDIEWLLSIDDDELFYCEDAKDWPTWSVSAISFRNHEVVQSTRKVDNIFLDMDPLFKVNPVYVQKSGYHFLNYLNGKSAVRVKADVAAAWYVHGFSLRDGEYAFAENPMILHYPAVTYDRWVKKYKNLGNFSNYWCEDESLPISQNDLHYIETRDVVSEALKTGDWEPSQAFYYSLFPHREDIKARLLEQGLLRKIDVFSR